MLNPFNGGFTQRNYHGKFLKLPLLFPLAVIYFNS